jgi:hypothetical protein
MATDYTTACGDLALSWLQMMAASIRGYRDLAGVIHYRLNGLEATANCSTLEDLLTCATSHIEAERQLVENTFALDDCGLLAMKIFNNQDNDWVDYGVCAEMPKSFLQMLALTIKDYNSHKYINAVIDTGVCTSVTALLDCTTNQIEAERLLVQNVFAVDDCDKTLIKFFSSSSEMTDYHTECIDLPQSFYQLLARCIVTYNGHNYINSASVTGSCDDLLDFWTCANNHIAPERALVENLFATDACGNLALKVFNNSGGREQ